jgi:RNA polymerase sigma-70 factor (ECF subfamily)
VHARHGAEITTYILRAVRHRETAEDIASETFMIALRSFSRFRDRGDGGRAWLYRIATNELRRHWRRSGRSRRERANAEPAAQDGATDDRSAFMRCAFDRLPWKHRSVLLLHHVQELSINEVSVALGRSRGAVKSQLQRARRCLEAEVRTLEKQQ